MTTAYLREIAKIGMMIGLMGLLPQAQAGIQDGIGQWQLNLLNNPSQYQLAREQAGRVMIYDGLTDKEVDQVMDSQFERLGAMMFTGVVITDTHGRAMIDPETHAVMVEDDGC